MNLVQSFKDKSNLSKHLKENFERCRKIAGDIANAEDPTELNEKLKDLKSLTASQLAKIIDSGVV
jgi:hypothetical protein